MKYIILLFLVILLYLKNFYFNERFFNTLVSPDIIKAHKIGTQAKIHFMESIRQSAEFDERSAPAPTKIFEYIVYYLDEDSFQKLNLTPAESTPAESTPAESTPAESTPAESDNLSPSESAVYKNLKARYKYILDSDKKKDFDLNDWEKKDGIFCDKEKCSVTLTDLDDKDYRVFVLKKDGDNISDIRKVIKFGKNKAYNIGLDISDSPSPLGDEIDLGIRLPPDCDTYTKDNCPTNVYGSILSRCWIKNEKCDNTLQQKLLR